MPTHYGTQLRININRSASSRTTVVCRGFITNSVGYYVIYGGGAYTANLGTAVIALGMSFRNNTGTNFTKGTYRLYGIVK